MREGRIRVELQPFLGTSSHTSMSRTKVNTRLLIILQTRAVFLRNEYLGKPTR